MVYMYCIDDSKMRNAENLQMLIWGFFCLILCRIKVNWRMGHPTV